MTADSDRFDVALPDGRSVEVLTAGTPGGLPLVFHTGTPSGLASFPPLAEAAAQRGLRLVCYTRPGYGNSTPQPGRSSPARPPTSRPSSITSASGTSSPRAGPAAARTRWRQRHCWPGAAGPPPRSPE